MARLIPKGGGGLPVGVPMHLPLAQLPKNTVLLDGSAMPSWASSQVKAMYGATLPDYRGRAPVGTDEGAGRISAAWAKTPGQGGGADTHKLGTDEMPSHDHAASASTNGYHGHSGSTGTDGSHRHSIGLRDGEDLHNDSRDRVEGGDDYGQSGTEHTRYAGNHNHSLSINGNGNHSHNISIGHRGGNAAHNNMQPSIAGRWVMRLK
ncbi:hypothetical protein [Chromohalobacter israelensis]|uniref:hypothetical protein n=1 Tax=Chromohalobacter israelensis TaxID=141390 RepID=UPI00265C3ADF|nr:hypothetical protein [Chromohalobacter salexigens]MDO0946632.1 hypothetical protein [Chromohalobacter salexigens]